MVAEAADGLNLPVATRDALGRFCGALAESLGERLGAVVLYGGAARGEYVAGHSDLNVMVVLADATTATLDRLAEPVFELQRAAVLALLLVTEDDLRRSADVFPIKFLDMQRHHRVLWGRDSLTELAIDDAHLRLRCEQEIKNLLLRLRAAYVQRSHRPELLRTTLVRASSTFLADLAVLVHLRTGELPVGKETIADTAARALGLDTAPVRQVLAIKAGAYEPDPAELTTLYDAFLAAVQQAATLVDELEVRVPS